ncbi:MAG TPA: hypothetical protein VLB27_08595 [candidate division Zixibacteria bacterium]|nr:hypothetical protein [candidate division Zixibacteria bacterium]
MGEPDYQYEFAQIDSLLEYQFKLRSLLKEEPRDSLRILELTWNNVHSIRKVWFLWKDEDWICIDNLEWDPQEIEF